VAECYALAELLMSFQLRNCVDMLKFDREISVVILRSTVPGIFCAGLYGFCNFCKHAQRFQLGLFVSLFVCLCSQMITQKNYECILMKYYECILMKFFDGGS